MSVILSTYLPSRFETFYRFSNGNDAFFTLENTFLPNDFLLIDLYDLYYISGKEIIEDVKTFLLRIDAKGVQWLFYIPDNGTIREIFLNFHIRSLPSPRHIKKIPSICITNYPIKS